MRTHVFTPPRRSIPTYTLRGCAATHAVLADVPKPPFRGKSAAAYPPRRSHTARNRHAGPSEPCPDPRRSTPCSSHSSEPDDTRENRPPRPPGRRCCQRTSPYSNPSPEPSHSDEPSRSSASSTSSPYSPETGCDPYTRSEEHTSELQ